MTQPEVMWTHDDGADEDRSIGIERSPLTAVAALLVTGFCLLRLGAGLYDISRLRQFDEPLAAWDQLQFFGQLALSDPVSLALALGFVVAGFVVSARDSLAPLERTALLVLAGVSAAIALVITVALWRHLALEPHETLDRPYVWNARAALALGALTRAAIAVAAFKFAERYAADDADFDYDDSGYVDPAETDDDADDADEAADSPDDAGSPPTPPAPPPAPPANPWAPTPPAPPPNPWAPAPPAPPAPPLAPRPPDVRSHDYEQPPPPVDEGDERPQP